MPLPAEIRLIGDENQGGDNRAHGNDEPVLLAKATREYDWRQAPDRHPRSPVERPCEFGAGPNAAPPPNGQVERQKVQRRKLEIDGYVDVEPEHRFDDRITLIEVVEAVARAYRGDTCQSGCIEHGDHQMLRRVGGRPVAWQKWDEDHRGEKRV